MRLPAVTTLAQFDFAFQPSIKRKQIENLHELGFLGRRENIVLLGPLGVGKTRLVISPGDSRRAERPSRPLAHPGRPDRIARADEIGYLPVNRDGTVLLFQLVKARHEQASTVLTSNKGFEEWGAVLGDDVMAAALIDRLRHTRHRPSCLQLSVVKMCNF